MNNKPSLQNCILLAGAPILLILWIYLCEVLFGWNLNQLGVYPRTAGGLIGIITAPLIHGSWQHVLGNSAPLLLLGSMLLYGYPRSRWWTLAIIWLLSGTGVWLFARESYHFGASGITHGMFFYLFIGGILRRDKRSSALLMIAFYLYGGMLMTIFPREPGVSFESHLFGALSGVLGAVIFRHWDPKPARRTYSWELEADDEPCLDTEDPIIGDQWKNEEQRAAERFRVDDGR